MDSIDVPLLLAGFLPAHPRHADASALLDSLCSRTAAVSLPLAVVMTFLRTVTAAPWNMPSAAAVEYVHALVSTPGCRLEVPGDSPSGPQHVAGDGRLATGTV